MSNELLGGYVGFDTELMNISEGVLASTCRPPLLYTHIKYSPLFSPLSYLPHSIYSFPYSFYLFLSIFPLFCMVSVLFLSDFRYHSNTFLLTSQFLLVLPFVLSLLSDFFELRLSLSYYHSA